MPRERLTLEELERLPYLKMAIENDVSKLLELEKRKTSIRSGFPTGMPGSGVKQTGIDDFLAIILEQQERIKKDLQQTQKEWYNTRRKIDQIPNLRIRLIILHRFEDNLTWQEVSNRLGERDSEYAVKSAFRRWMKLQEALSQK